MAASDFARRAEHDEEQRRRAGARWDAEKAGQHVRGPWCGCAECASGPLRQVSCPCPRCLRCCCAVVPELVSGAAECVNREQAGICPCWSCN